MASKQFKIDDQITVNIYKRKTNRNLRLSISSSGEIRVSMPLWAPYSTGLTFVKSKLDWIKSQYRTPTLLNQKQLVGKAHHIIFISKPTNKITGRIVSNEIRISHPNTKSIFDIDIQNSAKNTSIRALRLQAEQLLPKRLEELASLHDYQYKSVSIKRLKSRWGSCDQKRNIVFNLFLIQLPWELIDYVIIHEMVHTKIMRHGPDFWLAMADELPNLKVLKSQIKKYHPILHGSSSPYVA